MKIQLITLFPEALRAALQVGVLGQAQKKGLMEIDFINPREFTEDAHKSVDDKPFGGSDGMLMMAEPLARSVEALGTQGHCVYLSPQGELWNQSKAKQWAKEYETLTLICGRYAGVDQRFIDRFVDQEISVGHYVLSGGEPAAWSLIDSLSRWIPGVLGNKASVNKDSLSDGERLEAPQYTRPAVWRGAEVPEVLRQGDHKKIEAWKSEQSEKITAEKRAPYPGQNVSVALVHWPVLDRKADTIVTNVTHFDVHDIARSARTYGLKNYYIVNRLREQLMFVSRMMEHWNLGEGAKLNPQRSTALRNIQPVETIEQAIQDIENRQGVRPLVVATAARELEAPPKVSFSELKERIEAAPGQPVLLLFGTGFGLAPEALRISDALLEPIRSQAPEDYRHLSVRSAASICLDRLMSKW